MGIVDRDWGAAARDHTLGIASTGPERSPYRPISFNLVEKHATGPRTVAATTRSC
jgi:hypothetical protein